MKLYVAVTDSQVKGDLSIKRDVLSGIREETVVLQEKGCDLSPRGLDMAF